MKSVTTYVLSAMFAAFVLAVPFAAQQPQTPPDMTIDTATKTTVIENLIKELNDGYIFLESAKKMESDLRMRLANHEYDSINSARAFAEKLTSDVQSVSKDKHLRIRFSAQPIPIRKERSEPTEAEKAE